MTRMIVVGSGFLLSGFLAVVWQPTPVASWRPQTDSLNWYKGNTHTHTLNSDGDSTPDEVVRWYREHDYQFLVLTDHNFLTSVDGLNALHGADERFLVIKGEEVSSRFEEKPLHVNGLNVERSVGQQTGRSVVEILQRAVNGIRDASGIPHINHPNMRWNIKAEEMGQVTNYRLFEVYNGHPRVNNQGQGGGGPPGLEEMWDILLSDGKLLFGLATDDAHVFKEPWSDTAAKPGKGWVMVRAEHLAPDSILDALERGDFYASTGVELTDYSVRGKTVEISISEVGAAKYRVLFIGENGRLLKEDINNPATYEIKGDEKYVRAKILESNGKVAWTQPVMIR